MNEYVFRTVLAHLNLMKKSSEFVCSLVVYLSKYAVVFYIFTEKLKYMAKQSINNQYVNRVGNLEYLLLKNYCTRKQHFYE